MSFEVLKSVLKSAFVWVMSTSAVGNRLACSHLQPETLPLTVVPTVGWGLTTGMCWCTCVHALKARNTFGCPLKPSRWEEEQQDCFVYLQKCNGIRLVHITITAAITITAGSDGIGVPVCLSGLTVYFGQKSQAALWNVFKQYLSFPPSSYVLFILTLQTVSTSKKGGFFWFEVGWVFLSRVVYCAVPRYLKEQDKKTLCVWRSTAKCWGA